MRRDKLEIVYDLINNAIGLSKYELFGVSNLNYTYGIKYLNMVMNSGHLILENNYVFQTDKGINWIKSYKKMMIERKRLDVWNIIKNVINLNHLSVSGLGNIVS